MNKFKGIFSIVVGVSMITMWCMLLVTGQVPEVATAPYSIAAHILAEFIAAIMLIVGGIQSTRDKARHSVLNSVALGALLYSVVNSSGYYLELGDFAMVAMFGVIAVVSVVFIVRAILAVSRAEHTGSGISN